MYENFIRDSEPDLILKSQPHLHAMNLDPLNEYYLRETGGVINSMTNHLSWYNCEQCKYDSINELKLMPPALLILLPRCNAVRMW